MLRVFENDSELGEYTAGRIADVIRRKPRALISIAAGTSSLPAFSALLKRVQGGSLSFSKAAFIAMDEWLGYAVTDAGSMGHFLTTHFLTEAGFAETFLFDGKAPEPAAECARAETFIKAWNGIDYILFGIGPNGHIALNEPGTDPGLRTHTISVSPVTAHVGQKYFGGMHAELTRGITLGIANAMEASAVDLTANSSEKAETLHKILESDPTPDLPATLLKRRTDFTVLVTSRALKT